MKILAIIFRVPIALLISVIWAVFFILVFIFDIVSLPIELLTTTKPDLNSPHMLPVIERVWDWAFAREGSKE